MTDLEILDPVPGLDIRTMPELFRFCETICRTNFVPKNLRGNPAATMACVMSGREMGLGPMASMRHLYEVDGKVGCSAELMRSAFRAAGHHLEVVVSDVTVCTLRGRRCDGDEDEVTWTMEDAERARLVKKDGAWESHPRAMLFARATADLVRRLAPEVLLGGVSYTPDELGGPVHPADLS